LELSEHPATPWKNFRLRLPHCLKF
jgi:hypothetical protein